MRIFESRLIKSGEDAIDLLSNGKLAGMVGGKKFIPKWVLENNELFKDLSDQTIKLFSRDPNIASDQVLGFLLKASQENSKKWENALEKTPDTLIALSKAFSSQWVKKPEWQEKIQILIDDPIFDEDLWRDLEKDILEIISARQVKQGKKIANKGLLYETLYDDGTWKLFTPKSFEGDIELASHIEPFNGHTKTQWCTAAQEVYFKNYTRDGNKLYVIQKWEEGVYKEAWQLAFSGENHIEFRDKKDGNQVSEVRSAPEELLKKIIADNPKQFIFGENLFEIYELVGNRDLSSIFKKNKELKMVYFSKLINPDGHILREFNGETIFFGSLYPFDGVVKIPEGVTRLEGLQPEVLGEKNPSLEKVEEVILPKSLKNLGEGVFKNLSKLKEVVLPEGLKEIPKGAFSGCKSLESIEFPKSLEKIGVCAFEKCGFIEMNIPANISFSWGSFKNNLKLKRVSIDFKEVPQCSFEGCKSLREIHFSDDIKRIGEYAFNKTALETVTLPAGLKSLESRAFGNCKNLKTVKFPETKVSLGYFGPFEGCPKLVTVENFDGELQDLVDGRKH